MHKNTNFTRIRHNKLNKYIDCQSLTNGEYKL